MLIDAPPAHAVIELSGQGSNQLLTKYGADVVC